MRQHSFARTSGDETRVRWLTSAGIAVALLAAWGVLVADPAAANTYFYQYPKADYDVCVASTPGFYLCTRPDGSTYVAGTPLRPPTSRPIIAVPASCSVGVGTDDKTIVIGCDSAAPPVIIKPVRSAWRLFLYANPLNQTGSD